MSIFSYNILRHRVAPHPLIDPRATYVVFKPPIVNPQATQFSHVQGNILPPQQKQHLTPTGIKLHPGTHIPTQTEHDGPKHWV